MIKDSSDYPGVKLRILVPSETRMPSPLDKNAQVIAIVAQIFRMCSVLPDEDLMEAVQQGSVLALERIFVARPYSELYCEFVPFELFHEDRRCLSSSIIEDSTVIPPKHSALAWADGTGPTYSDEVAADSVRGRYDRASKCIRYTLKRLLNNQKTRGFLGNLKKVGMKDWEILSIIANIAVNFRMPLDECEQPSQEHIDRFLTALNTPEDIKSSFSPDLFTSELFEAYRVVFLGVFLSGWGLQLPDAATSDRQSLETFLIERYGLRRDDQPHEDSLDLDF